MDDVFTILGISLTEFLVILILLVLLFNPREILALGRIAGRAIRKLVHTPFWQEMVTTVQGVKNLPNQIVRESAVEDGIDEIYASLKDIAGVEPTSGEPSVPPEDR